MRWRNAVADSLLAGIAFEIGKRGFAIYLANVPTYRTIYGAFAPLLAFLVWVCYQERSHRFAIRGPVARVAHGRTGLMRGFNVR